MDATIVSGRSARGGRVGLFPWLVGGVCLVTFVALHVANHLGALGMAAAGTLGGEPPIETSAARYGIGLAATFAATYAALALAGAAIAAKTRDKILWWLPAAIVVISPLPTRLVLGEGPLLRPIVEYVRPWGWPDWLAAGADLTLVLLPGALVAARVPKALVRADAHQRLATILVASFGLAVFLLRRYGEAGVLAVDPTADLQLGVLFTVGVALGARRPWFPAVHLLVALLASEAAVFAVGPLFVPDGGVPVGALLAAALPPLLAVGLGVCSDPLARYLRERRRGAPARMLGEPA